MKCSVFRLFFGLFWEMARDKNSQKNTLYGTEAAALLFRISWLMILRK